MELVVVPKNIEEIELYYQVGIRTFVMGMENFSTHYPKINLDQIDDLEKKYSDLNLFVAINKMIFQYELIDLEKLLQSLSKTQIRGVFFYDLAVLSIRNRLHLPLELVWNQTHMVTNYHTCNYYFEKGVSYGVVASEITLEEILEIDHQTKMQLFVPLFGRPVMAHSRRRLLSNYFKSAEKIKEKDSYQIHEKDHSYFVSEDATGTSILSGKLINGIRPLFSLLDAEVAYGLIDATEVEADLVMKALFYYFQAVSNYRTMNAQAREKLILKSEQEVSNETGFFYQKTIYKVKK